MMPLCLLHPAYKVGVVRNKLSVLGSIQEGDRGHGRFVPRGRGRGRGYGGYGGSGGYGGYGGFNDFHGGYYGHGHFHGGRGRGGGQERHQQSAAGGQLQLGAAPVANGIAANTTVGGPAHQLAASSQLQPGTAKAPSGGSTESGTIAAGQTNTKPSDVPESSAQGAAKAKGKPYCYRCLTKGHTQNVCTTELSCEFCDGGHVTKGCPHMKGVQPTAIPCGYAVEGLGFYYIPYAGLPKAKPEEKLATVNVLDGSFTTEQMSVELERLLPDKETWNLQQQGVDSFSLNFPSAVLLDQMVKWGPMETKTAEGKISFEKGVENEVFKYEIPKIWVQFRGLPKDLREFPIIWAVGSILGSSRAVDMKFTKTFGQSRLKVAVLNPELIPELVDVVIGDFVYELQFRAEKEDQSDDPKPIDMEAPLMMTSMVKMMAPSRWKRMQGMCQKMRNHLLPTLHQGLQVVRVHQ